MRLWTINAGAFACIGFALCVGVAFSQEQPTNEQEILAGADARIEEHRKADAEVQVVYQGAPLAGTKLEIEQTGHEFLFGCNIFGWGKQPTPELIAAYKDQYAGVMNFATHGFYWPSHERMRGMPRHDDVKEVVAWCEGNGITSKGHPLAWNYMDARWYPDDADELYRLQQERIDDCVSEFEGKIDIWDVVNEATHFDRDTFMERAPKHTSMWKKYGQIDFTKACFEKAREANPGAMLLINDYRTDPAYEKLIEQLVDENGEPLYDVIGIQSHMHGGEWSTAKVWDVCERFSRFGVPLHFTELTILSGEHGYERLSKGAESWETTPEGEARQAEHVERIYTLLFSHPSVEAITWWDFSDSNAWQRAPAGFLRKDQTPKPAHDVLHRLVKEKWWTETDVTTNDEGVATFRGFAGDYVVRVTTPDGKTHELPLTLTRNADNEWKIELD